MTNQEETGADQPPRKKTPEEEREDRWLARWAKVWVPLVIGFVAGVGTCVGPYLERDVRNRVYEATYQDKQRALENQSELLKLQEEYLAKLRQIQEAEGRLAEAQEDLKAREAEVERLEQEHREAMASLRGRYARYEASEAARIKGEKAAKAAKARRAPWSDHGCSVSAAWEAGCDRGYVAVFAKNTPDEKVVVEANATCGKRQKDGREKAYETCATYARSFLRSKGVDDSDIAPIVEDYQIRDLIDQWNEVR